MLYSETKSVHFQSYLSLNFCKTGLTVGGYPAKVSLFRSFEGLMDEEQIKLSRFEDR